MFQLETLRLIRKSIRRFLSLTLIVFIGAGFMMGLFSTPQVMRESVDVYADRNRLQDLVVYSPYGFCNEDYQKLSEAEGIDLVFASKEIDCHAINQDGRESTVRVSELARKNNEFVLVEGRMPERADECIIIENDIDIRFVVGDRITLDYGMDDISDYLSVCEYTIVGIFRAPQYLGKFFGPSNFRNKDLQDIICVHNANFISDYYTTMYITLEGAEDYVIATGAYDRYINDHKIDLQNIAAEQQSYLRDKLVGEATAKLDDGERLFNEMKTAGQQQLDDALNQLEEARIQIISYEAQLATLDSLVNALRAAVERDAQLLESIYGVTVEVEGDITSILNALGLNGINYGSSAMEYTYKEYLSAIDQYNAMKGQIESAKAQYQAGLVEYEKGLSGYNKRIADAEEELDLARKQLADLPKSQWIVLDRDQLYPTMMFKNTCQQMAAISTVMPLMFFLVAALVCLTTMKRLVDEQRGQIGIFVALGYSKNQIIGKYVAYALLASLIGGISGCIFGQTLFPAVIYNTWKMLYFLPDLKFLFPVRNLIISVGLFALLMCSITAYVVNGTVKDVPASLMRPLAPKKGKEIFLQRIPFLWNALSFTSKITARNIFRYKSRFLMTIAGIAGCTGLLLMGFGIKDSVSDVLDIQYRDIYTYDYTISLNSDEHIEENIAQLRQEPAISTVTSYLSYTTRIYLDGDEKTSLIFVISPRDYAATFDLKETDKKTPIHLNNDGVVVSELFARNNHLKVGDYITIESKNRIKGEVRISNICEMYFQHHIFMTDVLYENTFDEKPVATVIAVHSDDHDAVYAAARNLPDYGSMSDISKIISSFENMIQALNLVIVVIILVAGSLAFVVLVNLTQVNISERVREIATLKVLGFNDGEVNSYIFKEIMLLSLIGCLIGLPIGIIEQRFVMRIITTEMIMFGRNTNFLSFVYAIVITILFTVIVLFFMRRPLRKVDMVESLKSVE